MRDKVEKILGFPIPVSLEFAFQRLIIQDHKAEQIAMKIKFLIDNPEFENEVTEPKSKRIVDLRKK